MNQIPIPENSITDSKDTSVIAIEELDSLISKLIREGGTSVSPLFLDWVADSLTATILSRLEAHQQSRRFKESLLLGNPRIAIAHWIKHWTCSEIREHFPLYGSYRSCL
jgi:hypothetical protein